MTSYMARTTKKGLYYFPLDVDLFQDLRIRKLIKYQGGKAVTVYALLLCTIYRNGYYAVWDKELPFIFSELSGYTEAYVQEVIDCCLNIGLLSKELFDSAKVLTSRGIQQRYRKICTTTRRNVVIDEYSLLDDPDTRHAPVMKVQPAPPKAPSQEPPVSATPTYDKTPPEEAVIMKSDTQWLESVCRRYSITSEQARSCIDDFTISCSKSHRSLQDARSHFCRWLALQKKSQSPTNPTATPSQTSDYTYTGGFGGQDT